jgi:hypothetical protein
MNTIKKALLGLAVCAGLTPAEAQVSSVRYGIKYNTTTCLYDVYMKVMSGSALTGTLQQASTAQLTIVVPTGTAIGTKNAGATKIRTQSIFSNEPKDGQIETNGSATRFDPTAWTNANAAINRTNLTGYDAYSFVPTVSNAFYPPMNTGDTVVLFSINIAAPACGAGVRLWNNNVIQGLAVSTGLTDPTSANFGSDDYNNGMGIGSSNQIYTSNAGFIAPPKPTVTANRTFANNQIQLTSTASANAACATGPLEYVWTGPDNFYAVTQNATVSPVTNASFGVYNIKVSNSLGCATTLALNSISLPVKISKFEGSAAKCAAVLNWATASETGFSRFDVEYSNDGDKFMTVGEVESKKQATGSSYSYTYAQPSGKGYYRLKAIDLNGLYSYSEIVKIQTNCGAVAADIIIAPNPTSGNVSIRGIAAGTEIRIMDMLGKVVANEISNGAAITVNLGNYANGLYNVLVAQNGAWEKVGQIVKN